MIRNNLPQILSDQDDAPDEEWWDAIDDWFGKLTKDLEEKERREQSEQAEEHRDDPLWLLKEKLVD